LIAIIGLILSDFLLWIAPTSIFSILLALCIFFSSFSILEAFLPSLVSRTAPATRKGSALGLYSCAQFFGIFMGGVLGGWLYGQFSFSGVYFFCIILAFIWLIIAFFMQAPRYWVTRMWRILPSQQKKWCAIAQSLQQMPGMVEVIYIAEEETAYLKMERKTSRHPDFLRLQEQLQSN
jgi:MFS family permease